MEFGNDQRKPSAENKKRQSSKDVFKREGSRFSKFQNVQAVDVRTSRL